MDTRHIRIADFDYPLPDDRIAKHPLPIRDGCRLLVSDRAGTVSHDVFRNLPALIPADVLIVANETKVIRARMEFFKESGSRIEIFLLEPLVPADYVLNFASDRSCTWSCLVGNMKRWKGGSLSKKLEIPETGSSVTLKVEAGNVLAGNSREIKFSWDDPSVSFARIVEEAGNIPIPPYLKRESEESDSIDYQTVYSQTQGSVAAPTAGLHFTPELLETLRRRGNDFATVTLHVGAGTFQPVKSEEIGDHPMHREWISVPVTTIRKIIEALRAGRDILAVGTTSVRTLESLPYLGNMITAGKRGEELNVDQWMPYREEAMEMDTLESLETLMAYAESEGRDSIEATTSIMIAPGFRWRIVNRLITNFHQPQSTLLLLVSSFLNPEGSDVLQWRKIYEEALGKDYRFLSYGDACLLSPVEEKVQEGVELPLSKSIALRAATVAAVAGESVEEIAGILDICDDTQDYLKALKTLRRQMEEPSDSAPERIDFRLGATPLRFFIALAASTPDIKLDIYASEELSRRPIAPLVEALRSAGADIEYIGQENFLPLRVKGCRLRGGRIAVDTSISSQYLSALILSMPLWENPGEFVCSAERVSEPYIEMTRKVSAIPPAKKYSEPDWSAAAFFYETAMLFPGKEIHIRRLVPPARSVQGDSACCDIFAGLGVKTIFNPDGSADIRFERENSELEGSAAKRIEFDLSSTPDLLPALVAALTLTGYKFKITGVAHVRKKECDRIAAMKTELAKLGYELADGPGFIAWDGRRCAPGAESSLPEIDTYADHRIAMAFAPIEEKGLCLIKNREVVAKSYPDFWRNFNKIMKGEDK